MYLINHYVMKRYRGLYYTFMRSSTHKLVTWNLFVLKYHFRQML